MAATLFGQATGNNFGTDPATAMGPINSVPAGALLVVCFRERDNGAITGVSDDVNGAWTQAVINGDGTSGQTGIYYFANSASGNVTATITFGASRVLDCNFSAYEGVEASPTVATASSDNVSGTSHSHGSVNPGAASLMIASMSFSNTHGGLTEPTGYDALSIHASAAGTRQYYMYKPTHTGAETATLTSVTERTSNGVHASFTEAGGAVSVVPALVVKQRQNAAL